MKYSRGSFFFENGLEEEIAYYWMWTCLTDTSLWGRIVLIWRIIRQVPPPRFFEIMEDLRG